MKQEPKTLKELLTENIDNEVNAKEKCLGLEAKFGYVQAIKDIESMLERRIEELDKGGIQESWMMIELCRIIGKGKK